MIVSVTLNPSVDFTLYVNGLVPNDTDRIMRVETDAGGKGVNLARVVSALDMPTVATGFLGGDAGAFVKSVLDRQAVPHRFVEVAGETRTNYSIEDGSGCPPTTLNTSGPHIDEAHWQALMKLVETLSRGANWTALGGSLPPGVPVDAYRTLCDLARSGGGKVALDADGEPARKGLEARPDFFKPNAKEAGRLLACNVDTDEQAVLAAEEIREYLSPEGVCVVSLGARGAAMATPQKTLFGEGISVEARSTVGSGDSMMGAILVGLSKDMKHGRALELGLAAGAATAMTDGTTIADRDGIERLLPLARVESAR